MKNSGVMLAVRNLVFVGFTLAFAPIILSDMAELFIRDKQMAFLTIYLLVASFFWLINWTVFIQEEVEMLDEHFDIVNLGWHKYFALIASLIIGILFGFLINSLKDIVLYLGFAIAITACSLIGDLDTRQMFKKKILTSKRGKDFYEKAINNYYLKTLYLFRIITSLSLYMLLFILVLLNPMYKILTYLITASIIIISEVVILVWRVKRDRNLYHLLNK